MALRGAMSVPRLATLAGGGVDAETELAELSPPREGCQYLHRGDEGSSMDFPSLGLLSFGILTLADPCAVIF